MLSTVTDCEISDQERCSDHNILRYNIGHKPELSMDKNYEEVK
jgi:hypothetical protein